MKIELNEIYTFKLSTGDEIVTKVIEDTDTSLKITKPLVVLAAPQGIQMVMGLFTADLDAEVTLNKSQVSMFAPSRPEVRDAYIETTTGIKPVANKILMG
jgi:hypothetical protein